MFADKFLFIGVTVSTNANAIHRLIQLTQYSLLFLASEHFEGIKEDLGTQSGKILRLRGKGLKDINGYETGDQLVYINVWTPKKLSPEEKVKLESLRNSPNFEPKPDASDKGFFERMKEFFN